MKNKLTLKRRKFIAEYLCCWNAAEAARRAGYRRQSNVVGSELLRHPLIRGEIERRLDEVDLSADMSLALLSRIARADMGDYIKIRNNKFVLDLNQAKEKGVLSLIKKLRLGKNKKEFAIELWDSMAALEILAKIHGLYKDKIPEPDSHKQLNPFQKVKEILEEDMKNNKQQKNIDK